MEVDMKKKIIIYIPVIIIFMVLVSCKNNRDKEVVEIDFSKKEQSGLISNGSQSTLTVAVSAMISPQETFRYYQQLLNYIAKKTGMTIHITQRKTYQEVNNLLKLEELDMAFICSGAYLETLEENYVDLLVVPQVNNESYYFAYIIVHKDSSFKDFKDLKDRRFAYTDILSNTGRLYPLYLIARLNENPRQFFSKTLFTYGHDNSIHAVSKKIVDGASVDSLIFNYIKKNRPQEVSDLKIIKKSQRFGIPPVVVKKSIDVKIKTKLQKILQDMANDPEGKKILNNLMIDKFISAKIFLYRSIMEMKLHIKKLKTE